MAVLPAEDAVYMVVTVGLFVFEQIVQGGRFGIPVDECLHVGRRAAQQRTVVRREDIDVVFLLLAVNEILRIETHRHIVQRRLRGDDVHQVVHRIVDDVPILMRRTGHRIDVVPRYDARVDGRSDRIAARAPPHIEIDQQGHQQRTDDKPIADTPYEAYDIDQ